MRHNSKTTLSKISIGEADSKKISIYYSLNFNALILVNVVVPNSPVFVNLKFTYFIDEKANSKPF